VPSMEYQQITSLTVEMHSRSSLFLARLLDNLRSGLVLINALRFTGQTNCCADQQFPQSRIIGNFETEVSQNPVFRQNRGPKAEMSVLPTICP
jgi:hypothetical protein